MQKPLRVLHIVGKMNKGGVQSLLMNYYRNIDRTKVQFDFIVQGDSKEHYDDEILALGGRIHRVPRMTVNDVKSFSKAFSEIFSKNQDYQIVHSHKNWLNIIPLRIAKKHGVPVRISHSHGSYEARSFYKKMQRNVFQKVIGIYATDLVACSNLAGIWLYGERFLNDHRAKIIHNAIDADKFKFNETDRHKLRDKHNIKDSTHVLISVGRLSGGKNLEFLLDTFYEYQKLNQDSILVIAGDGPLRESLNDKSAKMGLQDKVLFLGMINNVHSYLSMSDLLVFPSESEGLGLVLIEAQANGLPTIVSKEGIPEEADVANTALFYSLKESPAKWAEQILKLRNVGRYDSLGDVKTAGYDIKTEAQKLEQFYLSKIHQKD